MSPQSRRRSPSPGGGSGPDRSAASALPPNALFDEEYADHASSVWHLSDGTAGAEGGWATGLQPDGQHEFGYLMNPEPLGEAA